eukprot:2352150-Alexandrium_andersonii.AAC.1
MVLICNAAATRRVTLPPPRASVAHDPVADDFVVTAVACSWCHLCISVLTAACAYGLPGVACDAMRSL